MATLLAFRGDHNTHHIVRQSMEHKEAINVLIRAVTRIVVVFGYQFVLALVLINWVYEYAVLVQIKYMQIKSGKLDPRTKDPMMYVHIDIDQSAGSMVA